MEGKSWFRGLGWCLLFLPVLAGTQRAQAADFEIHLVSPATISSKKVLYSCDGNATNLGLSSEAFTVEYINGGGNSLAVVPILGNSVVFASVESGSGARYVAQQYTWWDAKNAVTFSSSTLSGKLESSCHPMARR